MGQLAIAARTIGRPVSSSATPWWLILAVAVAAAALANDFGHAQTPNFPALTGRIVDQANILSAADRAEIEASLAGLDRKSSDQVVVVTLRTLNGIPIEDYGYQLGRHWKIGQAGTNNGILLIVAPNDRRVRIEVGRGLEPQMTDTMSKIIIDNGILPAFRRGDFPGGIKAGVRDIIAVLLGDAEEVKRRAASLRKAADSEVDWITLLFIAFWIAVVLYSIHQQRQQMRTQPAGYRHKRQRRGDGNIIVVPGGWGSSGGWSGGSGGGGDGGFSGGGGDFGGGGSSGSW